MNRVHEWRLSPRMFRMARKQRNRVTLKKSETAVVQFCEFSQPVSVQTAFDSPAAMRGPHESSR